MVVQVVIVNFVTISLLNFPITIFVLVSFKRRRLEPQFHYIPVIFFQIFLKLFNYHYVNSFHVAVWLRRFHNLLFLNLAGIDLK